MAINQMLPQLPSLSHSSLPAWARGVINPTSLSWLQTQADQGQKTTRKQFDAHLGRLSSDWAAANPNYKPMMPWDNPASGASGGAGMVGGRPSLDSGIVTSADIAQQNNIDPYSGRQINNPNYRGPSNGMGGGNSNYQDIVVPGYSNNAATVNPPGFAEEQARLLAAGPTQDGIWTRDPRRPGILTRNPNIGTPPAAAPAAPTVQKSPWFQAPFQNAGPAELPFWQKGIKR